MTDQIDTLKREAKKLSRATSITHMQALDVLAAQRGHTHWGALAESIGRALPAPRPDTPAGAALEHDPRTLLEHVFDMPLPHLRGCRHLLISGATSTGKTTMLSMIVAAIPSDRGIAVIEDDRDLAVPARAHLVTTSRTQSPEGDRQAFADALKHRPHVLLVGEVTTTNALPMLETMAREDAPMVASTIHARHAADASTTFALRVANFGRGRLPSDVAIVHIERGADGARRIAEVIRSR